MTTSWGRALMATPIVGQAVGMFAKGYAGIVASELKKCTPPPAGFPPTVAAARARLQLSAARASAASRPSRGESHVRALRVRMLAR